MNDTILNSRQKQILTVLGKKGSASRSELADSLESKKSVSKITILRDINGLLSAGFLQAKGKGKATRYSLNQTNLLLKYIDADKYFDLEPDSRKGRRTFNDKVFKNLVNLYSEKEINLWEKSKRLLRKRIDELDPSIYKRELERFVIEFSWKSSQIEGNTYSLIEAESLIKQNIEAKGHPKEEATMIINHKEAFNVILDNHNTFKKVTFSDIVQLHGVLTKGLVTSGLRSQPVRISGSIYNPPSQKHDLDEILKKLVNHISATKFSPERALIVAAMIAYVQPFADGNKRTARMLANAILMSDGYYPLSYRNVDVNEYRKAIIIFYEQNNLYHFKNIFVEQLEYAIENYFLT